LSNLRYQRAKLCHSNGAENADQAPQPRWNGIVF